MSLRKDIIMATIFIHFWKITFLLPTTRKMKKKNKTIQNQTQSKSDLNRYSFNSVVLLHSMMLTIKYFM